MAKEKNQKTFGETPLSDSDKQYIISALKEEGFNEEQLNAMTLEKVWKLFIDSFTNSMSDHISRVTRAFERNPQLALTLDPLIKRLTRELENLADSAEKELDEKEKKGV